MDVGQVVKLRGFEQRMTIEEVGEDPLERACGIRRTTAKCVWFDATGDLRRGEFGIDALEHAEMETA